jgi:hypothetical protein
VAISVNCIERQQSLLVEWDMFLNLHCTGILLQSPLLQDTNMDCVDCELRSVVEILSSIVLAFVLRVLLVWSVSRTNILACKKRSCKAMESQKQVLYPSTLFRVADWSQIEQVNDWDMVEKAGYDAYNEEYVRGVLVAYCRLTDKVFISQYSHCSCYGTRQAVLESGWKHSMNVSRLGPLVVEFKDLAFPQRHLMVDDFDYLQMQLVYEVLLSWLREDKPQWEGTNRSYHVRHGAGEPRHLRI